MSGPLSSLPFPSESSYSDTQLTSQQLLEESLTDQQQSNPHTSSSSVAASTNSTVVEPQNSTTFASQIQPQNYHQAQFHSQHLKGTSDAPFPPIAVQGGPYVAPVTSYPPLMPTYTPLPPPSSAIPVSLMLEGESKLLTPSLNNDLPHNVLEHTEEIIVDNSLPVMQTGREHIGVTTYTQQHPPTFNQQPNPAMSNAPAVAPDHNTFHAVAPATYSQPSQPYQFINQPELQRPRDDSRFPPQVPTPGSSHPGVSQPQPSWHEQPPQPLWHEQQPQMQVHSEQAWYGVPPQIPPSSQSGSSQQLSTWQQQESHALGPFQQADETQSSSKVIQVHPNENSIVYNRVVNGPTHNPPSYEQAKQLPSHPPVQLPIPPPVSLPLEQMPANQAHVVPHQQVHFTHPQYQQSQSMHHPQPFQVGYHTVGINPDIAARDAKIEELTRLLDEKEKATQSKVNENEQIKKMQDEEKKELKELKESLEAQRNQLEQAKQQQQAETEREVVRLRQKLNEERAQMTMALEQERAKLEVAKVQHIQEMQQRERDFKQMKEQYEREITERQRQNSMQQLEERRKQEHMFSLSQGLPPGWKKRLDTTTGRFYYVDHNSKTTHWNPPTSWLDYQAELQRQQQEKNHLAQLHQQQEALNARLRAQQQQGHSKGSEPHGTPSDAPHSSMSSGASQSPVLPVSTKACQPPAVSSPSAPAESPATGVKPLPSVDRSTKPSQQPHGVGNDKMPVVPDRSTKPAAVRKMVMTPAIRKQKTDNLQPVFGSGVSCLLKGNAEWYTVVLCASPLVCQHLL